VVVGRGASEGNRIFEHGLPFPKQEGWDGRCFVSIGLAGWLGSGDVVGRGGCVEERE
jgi:hypothetical protein